MKKGLIIVIIILLIAGAFYFLFFKNMKKTTNNKNPEKSPTAINGARIAMIIAYKDFRDEEYFVPRGIFDEAGAEVKTEKKLRFGPAH